MNPPPIKTSYWKKPIPSRMHDWEAWYEGEEESYTATGPTEKEAITDLMTNGPYAEDDEQLRYETETEIWNANDSEDLGGAIMWRKLEP